MPGFGGVGWEDDVVYRDVRGGWGDEREGGPDGRVRGEGVAEAEALELGGKGGGGGGVVAVFVAVVGVGGHQGGEV